MRSSSVSPHLWQEGDIVLYKSYSKYLAMVMAKYGFSKTGEPVYIVGVICPPKLQYAHIYDPKDEYVKSFLHAAIAGKISPQFQKCAAGSVKNALDDPKYTRYYEQETSAPFSLTAGELQYYRKLVQNNPRSVQLAVAQDDSREKFISRISKVHQHLLAHPIDNARQYHPNLHSLNERRN
ncbi:MAG: hypothetical protein HY364_02325 [Candidatus Aenigmarchaeota archaeon]|nr:hypothetical protein [Candidatus Aenigmarchaeota archaeon]